MRQEANVNTISFVPEVEAELGGNKETWLNLAFQSEILKFKAEGFRATDDTERTIIADWLRQFGEGLNRLEMSDLVNRLPTLDQVIVGGRSSIPQEHFETTAAFVSQTGLVLALILDGDGNLDSDYNKLLLFHELGHFITNKILEATPFGLIITQIGFDRRIIRRVPNGAEVIHKGLWEESLANLLALACLNEDKDYPLIYPDMTASMLSTIQLAARMTRTTELTVLRELFLAKANRNFGYQVVFNAKISHWRDNYLMRALNNLVYRKSTVNFAKKTFSERNWRSGQELNDIAERSGAKEYIYFPNNRAANGAGLRIDGVEGRLKKHEI